MLRCYPAAVSFGNVTPICDAEQRIMRFIGLTVGKIGIIGCDQRYIVFIGEVDQRFFNRIFFRPAMALLMWLPEKTTVRPSGIFAPCTTS